VLHGPINLSIFQQYRTQTAGFAQPAFFGEPRNPDYYPALLAGAGYAPAATWNSWDIPGEAFGPFFEAMQAKGQRRREKLSAYTLAPFDLERFEAECALLYPVVCDTFKENYGYTAISFEEFLQRFADVKHLMCTGASHKALDAEGRLVAYSYTYADVAAAFQAADGDHTRLDLTRPAPDAALICHTFGIVRAHRNMGLAEYLFEAGFPAVAAQHTRAVGALAKQRVMIYARFGAPSRSYAVYAKELA